MSSQVRAAGIEDIEDATDVFLTTLDDLKKRNGLAPTPMDRDDWLQGYTHVLRTGIFNVVEVDGRVVGLANGVVRDSIWFLSGFWMLPPYQGKGLGRKLIEKTWADARAHGADQFFVWASIDAAALGNYMRLGMLPGYQIFTLRLTEGALAGKLGRRHSSYELEELTVQAACEIDRAVRATERLVDHQYWLFDDSRQGFAVRCMGELVGYFYLRKGVVGALAYLDKAHEQPILDIAMKEVLKNGETIFFMVPGINRSTLSYLMGLSARIVSYSHFLTSAPFGNLENYLPSGPHLY
ncbi:MAG TPA: GNAT family N-acetyltransferase [Candidatus Obscuribacter sp.]|nr:GNAT family N-acetyltransferase [Candidatus Obscuribacter sp.]